MRIVFAFDLGTASIGAAVVDVSGHVPVPLHAVSRIFRPPAGRGRIFGRRKQHARTHKRRRRWKNHRRRVVRTMEAHGFLPEERKQKLTLFELDPGVIENACGAGPLPIHWVGRLVFNILFGRRSRHTRAKRLDRLEGLIRKHDPEMAMRLDDLLAEIDHIRPASHCKNDTFHALATAELVALASVSSGDPRTEALHSLARKLAAPGNGGDRIADIMATPAMFGRRWHRLSFERQDRICKQTLTKLFPPHAADALARIAGTLPPNLSSTSCNLRLAQAILSGKAAGHPVAPLSASRTMSAGKRRRSTAEHVTGEFSALLDDLVRHFGAPDVVVLEAPVPQTTAAVRNAAGSNASPRKRRLYELFRSASADGAVRCPYSGKRIRLSELETPGIEIDHIRPLVRSGDDSDGNCVLAVAEMNRIKGDRTPFEAFAGTAQWPVITEQASALPWEQKSRLISPDKPGHKLSRPMARRRALQTICHAAVVRMLERRRPSCLVQSVSVSETAVARGHLSLPAKDPLDRRSHAVDALSAALAFLRPSGEVPEDVAAAFRACAKEAAISLRPQRQKSGRLHCGRILGLKEAAGLRRQRLLPVTDADNGQTIGYRLPADNHHADVVSLRDGSWVMEIVTRHDACQPGWRPQWERSRSGGKLVMRLHKGDVVLLKGRPGGPPEMMEVRRLCAGSNRLWLLPVACHAATDRQHHEILGISALRRRKAIAIDMSPAGFVRQR